MEFRFSATTVVIALLLLMGCAVSAPPHASAVPPSVSIERWADNHPEASRELGMWVRKHPAAARRFFEWDGTHPERSKIFVTWTITHPERGIDTFVELHPNWPVFNEIMERHRPAALSFMAWCRRHPAAAEAIMNHPRGLQWASTHLYRASREM